MVGNAIKKRNKEKILITGTGDTATLQCVTSYPSKILHFDDCANKDGLKHMLCPLNQECHRHGYFLRAPTEMIDKAIFVFGDILHGLHSIYRRGWAKQHFRGNFGKVVHESWSNFTLAPEGGDPSGVLSQIQNWQNASVPVLFIDFYQINSEYTRSAIQQFVGRTNLTLPKFDESKN